jgi:uncharacterized protein (DUF58 family)
VIRRWHFLVAWTALFVVALSTGVDILFYASYLILFFAAAAHLWTRSSVDSVSVQREVGQAYVHLGDTIELNYSLRNESRLGKVWLEVYEESNWPEPLLGRVISVGGLSTKRWKVEVPALRRGRFHLGPIVLRSGDPFGLFSAERRIRSDALLLVYPRVLPLPYWTLPGSFLEGEVLTGRRSLQATSMVMGIREYRPGDAFNRIHWKSSAKHRTLQVKEFELDRTADLWLFLDLDRRWHRGEGDQSTEERAVTIAASVVAKALREHRNVGMVTANHRAEFMHPDRGPKQFGKLMQYLAEITATGSRGLPETIVESLPRLRRGASALVITPSLDRAWVRPLYTLREGGVATQAIVVSGERMGDRDRARLGAIAGELHIAGVPFAEASYGMSPENLFRGATSASA